jgi:hypothetical protein
MHPHTGKVSSETRFEERAHVGAQRLPGRIQRSTDTARHGRDLAFRRSARSVPLPLHRLLFILFPARIALALEAADGGRDGVRRFGHAQHPIGHRVRLLLVPIGRRADP